MKKIFRILYISGLTILITACSSAPNNTEPPQKTKEVVTMAVFSDQEDVDTIAASDPLSDKAENTKPPQKTKEEIRAEILQREWLTYEGGPRAYAEALGFEEPSNIKIHYEYPNCSYNKPELCYTNYNGWFFSSEEIEYFLNPLPIKEIISILHKSQVEDPNENIPPSRLIGEITKMDLNGYSGYQFTTEWGFEGPCYEADFLKGKLSGCGYMFPEDIKVRVMVVENKGEKLIIMIDEDNPISKRILDSFEFIE